MDNVKVLAVCNQKGGVGKTTTTFHLARAATARGMRVLIVDADPQGNITSATSAEPVAEDQAGLADAMSSRAPDISLADVIVAGIWERLDLVPTSGEALDGVRDELVVARAGREVRLAEGLEKIVDNYHLVLIDCAPTLDLLTINALTAAQAALVVTHSKAWSLNGLNRLMTTINSVRDYYNPQLRIAGVIVNQHEHTTISGSAWLDDLHRAASTRQLRVLDPPIPKRVVIADAAEAAVGLDEWPTADGRELADIYAQHIQGLIGER